MKFTGDSLRPEKEFRFTNKPPHMAAQFGPVAALKRATISGEIRNVTACLGLPAFADLVRRLMASAGCQSHRDQRDRFRFRSAASTPTSRPKRRACTPTLLPRWYCLETWFWSGDVNPA